MFNIFVVNKVLSDPPSYEHYLTSSWKLGLKKIQARTGFELMTFAILVQRSTNWANKPTRSWSLGWLQINPPSGEYMIVKIWKLYMCTAVEKL